jgi:hypothetical protein
VSRRRGLRALAWASLLAFGCGKAATPLTQIVVVVDSNLNVPSELDAVSIAVGGAVDMPNADADLTKQGLPRSLALVHSGGALGPLDITVRGLHAGNVVVTRHASVSFRADVTLELDLPLERACAGANAPSCAADQTCKAGACADAKSSDLPVFDGADHFPVGSGGSAGHAGSGGGGHAGASNAGAGGSQAGSGGMAGRLAAGGGGGHAAVGGGGSAANGGRGSGGAGSGQAGQSGSTDAGALDMPDAGGGGAAGRGNQNQPPNCTIGTPDNGDSAYAGDTIAFSGSCDDPETGTLSVVRWTSNLDGTLSTAPQFSKSNLRVGTHDIALCGADPIDSSLSSCTAIQFSIATLPAMTASIDNLGQGGSSTQPFTPGSAITAAGTSQGAAPLTYAWSDSMLGPLGTGSSVTYAAPVPVGKHTLSLTINDARGRTASATRSFIVNSSSGTLCTPYVGTNSSAVGAIGALAVDANSIYVGGSSGVYRVDPTAPPSSAPFGQILIQSLSIPRDIFLHESSGLAFIGTASGYVVCPYTSAGITDTSRCKPSPSTSYLGGSLPSNDVGSLLRVTAPMPNKDFLLVGTTSGLLIADDPGGTTSGTKRLSTAVTDAVLGPSAVWLTSSNGLYSYDFNAVTPFNAAPTSVQTVSDLTSVAAASSAVWTGSSTAGIGRYLPSSASWNAWRVAGPAANGTSLVSDDVRDIAVQRSVTLAGSARDVTWIATGAGISRFDPSVPSFITFTTSDGLPSNSTRKIAILASGVKLFASDSGMCAYNGN